MRNLMLALMLARMLAAAPAHADVEAVVTDHSLPAFDRFAEAAEALANSAAQDCAADAVRPAYQAAFDAWMGVSHLSFGPLEKDGRTLAIAFWPDTRGLVPRTVASLLAEADLSITKPEHFAEVSVAGRGLFAMEQMLYGDDAGYGTRDYACQLVQAQTVDLAEMARQINAEWQEYGPLLITAGQPGNAVFLTEREAGQAIYTALVTALEFTKDQRVGRPLGTFERPRPERAEARLSGRSLRNVILSLEALRDMAHALAGGPTPETDTAFDKALQMARELDDPVFAEVDTPEGWLKVEILQQTIGFVDDAIAGEIGAALGLSQGFNSQDGD